MGRSCEEDNGSFGKDSFIRVSKKKKTFWKTMTVIGGLYQEQF